MTPATLALPEPPATAGGFGASDLEADARRAAAEMCAALPAPAVHAHRCADCRRPTDFLHGDRCGSCAGSKFGYE